MRLHKRFRPQPVQQAGLLFDDSSDSHEEPIRNAGEPLFRSNAYTALPRVGVRRLLDLDAFGEPESIWRRGMGAARSPHESLTDAVRRSVGRPVFQRAPIPHRTLEANRQLSWHAFQQLRVRVPTRVKFCQQRKARREVLWALGIAGKKGLRGRGGGYKRNENSNWRC